MIFHTYKNITKSLATLLLVTTISLSASFLFTPPKKAEALDTVAAVALAGGMLIGLQAIAAIGSSPAAPAPLAVPSSNPAENTKSSFLDVIVNILSGAIINSMIGSITNWVNSGFEGKPAFAQNFKKELKKTEGDVTETILKQIKLSDDTTGASFFCGPFSQTIKNAFRVQLALKRGLELKHSACTIDSILEEGGRTLEDFENDFTQGGWPAWLEVTTNPSNNRFGAYFTVQKEIWDQENTAKEDQEKQLTYGNGFLSQKRPGECLPGQTLEEISAQIDQEIAATDDPAKKAELSENLSAIAASTPADGCAGNRGPDKIETPGNVIANQVNGALALGNGKIVSADEIDELVSALLGQIVQGVLSGVGGLLGASEPGPNGEPSLTDQLLEEADRLEQAASDASDNATNPPATQGCPPGQTCDDGIRECTATFGGQPASREVVFEAAGPYIGDGGGKSFASKSTQVRIQGMEPQKFYDKITISFNMKLGEFGDGAQSTFMSLERTNVITNNYQSYFFVDATHDGSRLYYKSNEQGANITEKRWSVDVSGTHNYEITLDGAANVFSIKVDGTTVEQRPAGGTPDIVDAGDGLNLALSRNLGRTYKNIKVVLEPGGPHYGGIPAECGSGGTNTVTTTDTAQCKDGKDNDSDGKTDYPADSDCSSATDTSETSVPPTSSTYPGAEGRYVTDPTTGKSVLLAGAYIGTEFQDDVFGDNIRTNFSKYVEFLKSNNLNFLRLWREETTGQPSDSNHSNPMPYAGSRGNYNLDQWNQAYFDRMASDVSTADSQGVWSGVMLFNAWSLTSKECGRGGYDLWEGHPFNSANNSNGFNGDANRDGCGFDIQGQTSGSIWNRQIAYVDKVIDTVNQYDRVIYEVSNEGSGGKGEDDSNAWQVAIKNHIKDYEKSKPKQHRVQISEGFGMSGATINAGDVTSPRARIDDLYDGAPIQKVTLLDTDHGDANEFANAGKNDVVGWVWKNFLHGYNMVIEGDPEGSYSSSYQLNNYSRVIGAMNAARALADRASLKDLSPQSECSSGYCLGGTNELIAYGGNSATTDVEMGARSGTFTVEHINGATGASVAGTDITAGGKVTITRPSGVNDWIVYLKKK